MRKSLAVAVLLGAAALTHGQPEPPVIPPRYGVGPDLKRFPQGGAKEALASAVKAIEQGRIDYLAAHLLDPRFVDARVADRARQIETTVDRDLRAVRAEQQLDPGRVPNSLRLPDDPALFLEAVRDEARQRAFALVVRDVRDTLTDNPDHLRQLRRFVREGTFVDAGETASASLPALPDRQVFARRVENRWYVEDRQQPDPEPKK
jgi:hypothetical protein